MTIVSFIALHNGKWSPKGNYIDFRMIGLVVEIGISLSNLIKRLIDDLSLDPLRRWFLCVNMDRESFRKGWYELTTNKDVLWYLNMACSFKDTSCALIVLDILVAKLSKETKNEDMMTQGKLFGDIHEYRHDGLPVIEYHSVAALSDKYELSVDGTFGNKYDLQKAVNMVALRTGFQLKVVKSSSKYYNIVCINNDCKWQLKAFILNKSTYFMILKYQPNQTCSLEFHTTKHR